MQLFLVVDSTGCVTLQMNLTHLNFTTFEILMKLSFLNIQREYQLELQKHMFRLLSKTHPALTLDTRHLGPDPISKVVLYVFTFWRNILLLKRGNTLMPFQHLVPLQCLWHNLPYECKTAQVLFCCEI